MMAMTKSNTWRVYLTNSYVHDSPNQVKAERKVLREAIIAALHGYHCHMGTYPIGYAGTDYMQIAGMVEACRKTIAIRSGRVPTARLRVPGRGQATPGGGWGRGRRWAWRAG